MKTPIIGRFTIICILLFSLVPTLHAQPFTLDKKIKPVKLQLKDYKDWEGAKAIGGYGKANLEADYYFVKGASMFQPIDVFLIAPDGVDMQIELVKNNWEDVQKKTSTAEAEDGIANLKVRTYGDFGIRVVANKDSDEEYQLLVLASPEVKKALPSPFVAASKKEKATREEKTDTENTTTENKDQKQSGSLVWILGIVVLVLLVLVFVLLRKKGKAALLLLFLLPQLGAPLAGYSRGRGGNVDWEKLEKMVKAENLEKLHERIKKLKEAMTSTKDLLEQYFGMGECMTMPMPPGMPDVPSFCPDDEQIAIQLDAQNCAGCFTEAREKFNSVRYNLEQLRIIYKCTKDFSKKAIAFGDNTSGVHAVTGLTWQAEKAKIEGSVKRLEEAYDKKYAELLEKLQESMIALAVCEEQFGTPDWYDRYGYMFYEFVKEKYKRSGD